MPRSDNCAWPKGDGAICATAPSIFHNSQAGQMIVLEQMHECTVQFSCLPILDPIKAALLKRNGVEENFSP
jgi:hypothetical protein